MCVWGKCHALFEWPLKTNLITVEIILLKIGRRQHIFRSYWNRWDYFSNKQLLYGFTAFGVNCLPFLSLTLFSPSLSPSLSPSISLSLFLYLSLSITFSFSITLSISLILFLASFLNSLALPLISPSPHYLFIWHFTTSKTQSYKRNDVQKGLN